MTIITITQADNDAARDAKEQGKGDCWNNGIWDMCKFCPIAQAFARTFPPYVWLVSYGGARPQGAHTYWYSLGRELRRALIDFDRANIPILGSFPIYQTSEKHDN